MRSYRIDYGDKLFPFSKFQFTTGTTRRINISQYFICVLNGIFYRIFNKEKDLSLLDFPHEANTTKPKIIIIKFFISYHL